MKKTALIVMAAGIGSRYGAGIKQLAKIGPFGEIIMDYSVHDALAAGFDKLIFVIRKDIEAEFRDIIGKRIEKIADVHYAFQELDALPEGYRLPEGRTRPWGTAHALMQARNMVDCPFAVINADDFYGKEGYRLIHDFLVQERPETKILEMCMAGYHLKNTLSKNGSVNRGICDVSKDGHLLSIEEIYEIKREEDGVLRGLNQRKETVCLEEGAIASMNMFGLPEEFLDLVTEKFPAWLDKYGKEMKSEYLLPREINNLMLEGRGRVEVLPDHDRWFGVTYHEDRALAEEALRECIAEGLYPEKLYN